MLVMAAFDAVRIENIKVETCNVLTQPSVNLKVMLQTKPDILGHLILLLPWSLMGNRLLLSSGALLR